MEIPALSSSLSMTKLADVAALKVFSMNLDEMQIEGDGMKKMMEMAVAPHIGGNIDISL